MGGISIGRWIMASVYIVAGALHFVIPAAYRRMMPAYLPYPAALVVLSGAAEIAGGLGVLFAPTRAAAAIGIVLLLIAVFPANLYMAMHPEIFSTIPRWAAWLRLPLQLPLMAWAAYYIRHR